MSVALDVRPQVAAFALLMEAKLRENDHKGHWHACTLGYLTRRCGNELDELREVIHRQPRTPNHHVAPTPEGSIAIGREAADIANFAMMIADKCGALASTAPVATPECTGASASWCPVCGDCTCPESERTLDDVNCPLHSPQSKHADQEAIPHACGHAPPYGCPGCGGMTCIHINERWQLEPREAAVTTPEPTKGRR